MSWTFFILLFAVVIKGGSGLDCTQIPSSSVFAENTVHLPGPSDQLQIIPANWNCLYKISVPGNSTYGLYANVLIKNGLKGANDYIRVVDMMGQAWLLNKTYLQEIFLVVPGAEITIQVVTKSVYMMSKFEITVKYSNVQIGPTIPMKTGAEMNYINVASLRDGTGWYNTVTFVGTEPIYMSFAIPQSGTDNCVDCFVIDGTIDNQTQIHRMMDFESQAFTSKSNAITIVSSIDVFFLGLVFNPKSEANKLFRIISLAVNGFDEANGASMRSSNGKPGAVQVVNFDTNGIIMDRFEIYSKNCTAYVVSGPPNNSSKVLLDLSTPPKLPQSFDVKYFSVVAVDCDFRVYVKGYGYR